MQSVKLLDSMECNKFTLCGLEWDTAAADVEYAWPIAEPIAACLSYSIATLIFAREVC